MPLDAYLSLAQRRGRILREAGYLASEADDGFPANSFGAWSEEDNECENVLG